jgi:hypothetical protein
MSPTTITHAPSGWNTWDFRGCNRFVYLSEGRTVVTVCVAIWDETTPQPQVSLAQSGERPSRRTARRRPGDRSPAVPTDPVEARRVGTLYERFRWADVVRLGPHGPLGLPARLEIRAGAIVYEVEATDRRGTLSLTVRPARPSRQRVVFIFTAPAGESLVAPAPTHGTLAGCRVMLDGATWPRDYFVNIAEPYAIAAPGRAATVRVTPPDRRPARSASTWPAYGRQMLRGEGALAGAPEAMIQAVTWNTLYDTRRRLVSSPVSRDWCFDWRGVLVFCWDTYLVAALVAHESPQLARYNLEAVTAAVDELGFVPNYYMAHGAASRDRSMPPLGAYAVWKTQAVAPDRDWLAGLYVRLRRWNEFWMTARNGRGDGLLQWGSLNVPYEFPQLVPFNGQLQFSRQAAIYESGLDNSPVFDGVPFNPRTATLELDDIMLCSLYALDCDSLARLAACLGLAADAHRFRRAYTDMARRVNECLWDETHGIYCNRHWTPRGGTLSPRWAPTSFFPLLAGIAPPPRARRLVREHLLNPREFWGRWVIPSIARRDPAYRDNDYWRGRIWGPLNYLVAEGLRRYRFDDVTADLARKSLRLFMRNYRADGGVYENYNADTGVGGDVWNAARFYHWGGLLVLIAMQELINVEPTGFLRFGSRRFPDAGLRNVHIGPDRYDVRLDRGVHACRNGRPFLDCTTRAVIRLPIAGDGEQPIEVTPAGRGTLTLHGPPCGKLRVRLPDGQILTPRLRGHAAIFRW